MFVDSIEQLSQVDHGLAVESEGFNRGTARRGETDDQRAIIIPDEVLRPFLPPWMEERNNLAGDRIACRDFSMFVTVAALTGQSKVVESCFRVYSFSAKGTLSVLSLARKSLILRRTYGGFRRMNRP